MQTAPVPISSVIMSFAIVRSAAQTVPGAAAPMRFRAAWLPFRLKKWKPAILAKYSKGAVASLSALFPQYASTWRVDYASFRPVEEQGRNLPLRHRNDLMHLDAFPTRPTHGGRILRLFTNLHPTRDRVWGTADSFEDLAQRYAVAAGLKGVVTP